MQSDREARELSERWALVEDDQRLVGNKTGATRLGFALLLKFFELEARFPERPGELPQAAVDYVAAQVHVDAAVFADYSFTGRTIEYHRAPDPGRDGLPGVRRVRSGAAGGVACRADVPA